MHRPLAQPRRAPLQLEEAAAAADEPLDHPVGEAEQADLLRRRARRPRAGTRSRRGAAPRAPRRCCGRARPSSRAAASASQPTRRRARAAPTTRNRRAAIACAMPPTMSTRPIAMKSMRDRERRAGDAEVEVARHREVVGERRAFEVRHAGRPHARAHQPVVEPRGGAAPEVRADRLVDRARAPGAARTRVPMNASGSAERVGRPRPRRRARPSRSAKSGRAARRAASSTTHHAVASPGAACGQRREELPLVRGRAAGRITASIVGRACANVQRWPSRSSAT